MNEKARPLLAALSGERACPSLVSSGLGWGSGLHNEREGPLGYPVLGPV